MFAKMTYVASKMKSLHCIYILTTGGKERGLVQFLTKYALNGKQCNWLRQGVERVEKEPREEGCGRKKGVAGRRVWQEGG